MTGSLIHSTPGGIINIDSFADDGPTDGTRWELRVGLCVAGAFFVGFLGWAALAPLDAGAYAPGVVVVSGSRQAVQHREGGVISALRVQEGDVVRQGQVLVEINVQDVRALERALASRTFAVEARRARLIAERDGLDEPPAPLAFIGLPPEDQILADEAMGLERRQLAARRGARASQHGVLGERASQLSEQINGYNRQLAANREQQRLIGEELVGMKKLAALGYAPLTRVRALERAAADLTGADGAFRAQAASAREGIGETRMQALQVDRQQMDEVIVDLRQSEVELNELKPKLSAARDQLSRGMVRAPASGQVVGLKVFTVGGLAQPGDTLMEIVPKRAPLVIEARVSSNDADDIHVGQTTDVRLTAFHDRHLPLLEGTVTKLSADGFTDEKTGAHYFRAEVAVPPEELAALKQPGREAPMLKAGLPVEVVVPLRKRTALQYMIEPLQQRLFRAFREQ
ncbi:HlyD family type I secretion periplasmic adaptor subunit [Caulobacter sp. Root655]|uniref:HlyD family type I secretion periplasmic adaptor subunit n=1 Tax=Caulobacter sp. Root655 TaxID=1736578 RepID=UPI0009EABFB2|nr:HlyD family type I secretion periplasmic adaptor subunit [Caulobacter sp. Root655]